MTGKVAPPVRCETLAAIVARCGGTMETRTPATRADYALPRASGEVREFFRGAASRIVGAVGVARLAGGRVFRSGIVLSPDGASVARDVSLDFGKPEHEHWLLGSKALRAPALVKGTTAVIASTLASGYAHWLLDELPRLLLLDGKMNDARLVAHATSEFSRTALALRGWRGEVLEPRSSLHVQAEELVVPSLVGSAEWPVAQAAEMFAALVAPLEGKSRFGEKLFISREMARRRRFTNQAEVWSALEAKGFQSLRLEQLSWAEQINAFRHAKVIVGAHGAGLANLIFCAPGVRVLELFHRRYLNGGYWRLAAVRRLDYRAVVPPGEEALGDSAAGNRLDLTADVDQMLTHLAGD